jgi:hypothetical protein
MSSPLTFFATLKGATITPKLAGVFGCNFGRHLSYIYTALKTSKSFPKKYIKKLASQTENNYFVAQTLKINYAVNVCVFPR